MALGGGTQEVTWADRGVSYVYCRWHFIHLLLPSSYKLTLGKERVLCLIVGSILGVSQGNDSATKPALCVFLCGGDGYEDM